MKHIPLTQNKVAIVDDNDYETISQYKWYCVGGRYAARDIRINKKRVCIYMHRYILGNNKKFDVDHINHDGLDNRKENLRLCTTSENMGNQRIQIKSKYSKYKGVTFDINRKKWQSKIMKNKKTIHLGRFDCEEDAADAYNKKALELFGEYAFINKLAK